MFRLPGLYLLCLSLATSCLADESTPEHMVYLRSVDPGIEQDIRYASAHNFTGHPLDGYRAAECLLSADAAKALARVQAALKAEGYGLKVFDCYRPSRAVADMGRFATEPGDPLKTEFYPRVNNQGQSPTTQPCHGEGRIYRLRQRVVALHVQLKDAEAGCHGLPHRSARTMNNVLKILALLLFPWATLAQGLDHSDQLVDGATMANDWNSSERMRRRDDLYRQGIVIEHNTPASPAAGSCIFFHIWRGPTVPTRGCTAMDPTDIARLFDWLAPRQSPLLVQLPEAQYRQLRAQWGLPER